MDGNDTSEDQDTLAADYRAMAEDFEREREAWEWIEANPDEALPGKQRR